jgi:hypothetical protein
VRRDQFVDGRGVEQIGEAAFDSSGARPQYRVLNSSTEQEMQRRSAASPV